MYPAVKESQNGKPHVSQSRRLALLRPMLQRREDGQVGQAATGGEDDLRIMEHFVRNFIERSRDEDPL